MPLLAASALPPGPRFCHQLGAPVMVLWALTRCLQASRERLELLHSEPTVGAPGQRRLKRAGNEGKGMEPQLATGQGKGARDKGHISGESTRPFCNCVDLLTYESRRNSGDSSSVEVTGCLS